MSCKNCEEYQEGEEIRVAYYRWKNANIEMVGCPEHLREVFDALNNAQVQKEPKQD